MFLTGPEGRRGGARRARSRWRSSAGPACTRATASASSSPRTTPTRSSATRALLGLLPSERRRARARSRRRRRRRRATRRGASRPSARKVYDVRDLVGRDRRRGQPARALAALGRATWSPALARIEGRPVGVIANQPRRLGGVIDAAAAEKAALFVDACDRFGLPLVVAGRHARASCPGTGQERGGRDPPRRLAAARVRRGAGAEADLSLRKAYGGAVITMNSRDLGADLVFAWPGAEIGIMAARQAVGIVHRRELEGDDAGARARARGARLRGAST